MKIATFLLNIGDLPKLVVDFLLEASFSFFLFFSFSNFLFFLKVVSLLFSSFFLKLGFNKMFPA